jgi:hypothetical protein
MASCPSPCEPWRVSQSANPQAAVMQSRRNHRLRQFGLRKRRNTRIDPWKVAIIPQSGTHATAARHWPTTRILPNTAGDRSLERLVSAKPEHRGPPRGEPPRAYLSSHTADATVAVRLSEVCCPAMVAQITMSASPPAAPGAFPRSTRAGERKAHYAKRREIGFR